MKRLYKLTALMLCIAALFAVSSCANHPEPYSDSSFVGEWKASSIERREENVVFYNTLTLTFSADGSCDYNGERATWTPDEDNGRITVHRANGAQDISFTIVREGDAVKLKYRIDTYVRACDFTPVDSETLTPSASGTGTYSPDEPEPIEN